MAIYRFSLLFIAIAIAGINLFAQTQYGGVQYTYDLNGNRTQRQYTQVLMKRGVEEDSAQVEATITSENKITVAPNPTMGILKVDITGKPSQDWWNWVNRKFK